MSTIMNPIQLVKALQNAPVDFKSVIQTIENAYEFKPTQFTNGHLVNEANTNNGSCKIFAFAKMQGLSEQATLNAFGDFYTVDVLQHPDKQDHQNIRNFMQFGWQGIYFNGNALTAR